eukprot:726617-Pyramimonas_sp.AAC.1
MRDAIEDLGLQVMRMRFCHFGLKHARSNTSPSGSHLQVATTCTRMPTNLWRCTCKTAGKPAQPTEHVLDWHGQGAQKAEPMRWTYTRRREITRAPYISASTLEWIKEPELTFSLPRMALSGAML